MHGKPVLYIDKWKCVSYFSHIHNIYLLCILNTVFIYFSIVFVVVPFSILHRWTFATYISIHGMWQSTCVLHMNITDTIVSMHIGFFSYVHFLFLFFFYGICTMYINTLACTVPSSDDHIQLLVDVTILPFMEPIHITHTHTKHRIHSNETQSGLFSP